MLTYANFGMYEAGQEIIQIKSIIYLQLIMQHLISLMSINEAMNMMIAMNFELLVERNYARKQYTNFRSIKWQWKNNV